MSEPRKNVIELTPEEERGASEAVQPYRKFISDNPALLSLLYDIDLLPEQVRLFVNANRMIAVCELFKLVPAEAIAKAMEPKDALQPSAQGGKE